MIKKVNYISRNMAEKIEPKIDDKASIISINSDDNLAKLNDGWINKLFIVFGDIDKEYPEYPNIKLFDKKQACEIIRFIEKVYDNSEFLIVHCDAGVSRSAAVAKFIAELYNLPFNHNYPLYNKHIYRLLWDTYNYYFRMIGDGI